MADRRIVIPYKPRSAFQAYHANKKRFSVSVCHRRAGKTVARINRLIRCAVQMDRPYPPGRFAYVAPFRKQAKDIAWLYLQHYARPLIDLGAKVNQTELSITMPHNKALIALHGADNAESLRGVYWDGVTADEAQGIARTTLSTVIMPTLADYGGWLDASGTPRGWTNLLGELVKIAKSKPDEWYLHTLRASESGLINPSELALQRHLMSENEYEQEYECSFDAAITGAVYGKWISEADKVGRIANIKPMPDVPVHTSWDLGYDDSTAIWWWQSTPGEIRVLDYYEAAGEAIPHYCEIVRLRGLERGYTYGKHFVPHDASNELLAAGGRSIVQQAHGLGVKMFVVPATSQQNAIEATRKTIPRCWFDRDKCENGLNSLRLYQFEWDEDKKVFRSKPRHDWASHGADAFEIIGQVWQLPPDAEKIEKPRFFPHDYTADDIFHPKPRHKHERV